MMKHFLLSEQDLDEIIWDIENLLWQVEEKVRGKFINEADQYEDIPEEEN
jgi:hypothetical protein